MSSCEGTQLINEISRLARSLLPETRTSFQGFKLTYYACYSPNLVQACSMPSFSALKVGRLGEKILNLSDSIAHYSHLTSEAF